MPGKVKPPIYNFINILNTKNIHLLQTSLFVYNRQMYNMVSGNSALQEPAPFPDTSVTPEIQ